MFKTLKIPISVSDEDKLYIKDLQRQYSFVVRWSYNRFIEGTSEKEIRNLSKSLKNINSLNSWLIQCAILDADAVFKRFNVEKTKDKDTKKAVKTIKKKQILFGGKGNLSRFHKKLISKEEFAEKRLRPIDIQGEFRHKGNRMFNLDIQNSNSLTFKINRNKHIKIQLPKLKTNWLNQLWKMEYLASEKKITYTVKVTSENIYISFDIDKQHNLNLNENRCLGIDLNPNYIGFSILEFDKENNFKVLEKKAFDLSLLTKKSGKASSDKKSKYLHNKLKFETVEISKKISALAKTWNCKFVFLEDLDFKQKDSGLGKGFNRLTKNKWLKTLFQSQLIKRLDQAGIKHFKINPAYTSIVGNCQHDSFDPVNASVEIARRGMNVVILKTKKFYPEVWTKESLKELWKQTSSDSPKVWKEIFTWLKNAKVKYRVSLDELQDPFRVFSLNNKRSKVYLYTF